VQSERTEIIARMENKFEDASEAIRRGQKRASAPVGIGHGRRQRFAQPFREPVQFDANAGRGSAARDVENVG
jgi:hypothetical protein